MLAEKLRDFDGLSSDEKAAVRTLDRAIEARDPASQANAVAVLRRYHLWLKTLSDDERKQVETTPPSQRLALVTKLRASERSTASQRTVPLLLQLVGPSAVHLAGWLRFLSDLTPEERKELQKKATPVERRNYLIAAESRRKFPPIDHLKPAEEDKLLKKLSDTDPLLKDLIERNDSDPLSKESSGSSRKAERKKADSKKAENRKAQVRKRLADNYHGVLTPPKKVDAANLLRFESAMPPGIRSLFDQFPPEEAKRRLTVLYRLIYPFPEEIAPLNGTGGKSPRPANAPKTSPAAPRTKPARPPAPPL